MKSYKFEKYNDWVTCRVGKCEIVADRSGNIDHLTHGRTFRSSRAAAEYVAARPRIYDEFRAWASARAKAVGTWLHETPHFRFDCDGGALAVRVNGSAVLRIGCGADGNHPVYVVRGGLPPFWECTGVSLGDCTIEPLNYDCAGGEPLGSYDVKSAWFWRYGTAVAIVID